MGCIAKGRDVHTAACVQLWTINSSAYARSLWMMRVCA